MTLDNVQITRQQFIADYHRPKYHYLPPTNWMNDPNGVIQWGDQYHLFYQYNPYGANHANMHWGHAASNDLIHWEDLPVAIAPTPNTSDEGGIFSGSIVNDNGTPKMFYTGVNIGYLVQTQCLAIGSSDLTKWEKHSSNPIIPTPPPAFVQEDAFRDPFVWREEDAWYMAVGARMEGVGGAILLYQSDDLVHWDYLNPLLVGELATTGVMWECPNFFQLGDKWVLIISSHIGYATGTVLYFVGEYENHRFKPEIQGVLDSGYYYAPLTHLDNQNRRIMYGWIREGRSVEAQVEAGWSGVQAIPRILSLDSQNRLVMSPVDELKSIRGTHHVITANDLHGNAVPVSSMSIEMHVSFDVTDASECGIAVAVAPDGKAQTRISYDVDAQVLRVQRQYSTASDDLETNWQGMPHHLDKDETLNLLILLDGSVLEVIANGRSSITSRVYSQHDDNQHIHVIAPSTLQTLDIYEMPSIWSATTS
ncbi:MAG: glycoside hydrolase family 32 protein [Chloroflexota bacterium]